MMRFGRRLSVLAAVAFVAVGAGAQAKAYPVYENRDEPGRNPYEENITVSCSSPKECVLQFSTVPTGKRRVIEHVSCSFGNPGVAVMVTLGSEAGRLTRNYIGLVPAPAASVNEVLNLDTISFYDAGETPEIFFVVNGSLGVIGNPSCTLAGHNISLP